ncbi:MAG: hypothetical protein ABL951_12650 [Alphaproteobacteria bacterium]
MNIAFVLQPRQRNKGAFSQIFELLQAGWQWQNALIAQIRQRKTGHVTMAGQNNP